MQQTSTAGALRTSQVQALLAQPDADLTETAKLNLAGLGMVLLQVAAALGGCGALHWMVS